MKIGVLVEGHGEIEALRIILGKLKDHTAYKIFERPLRAAMQPRARNPNVIVAAAEASAKILMSRGAHRIIVLIDREVEDVCPPGFSTELQGAFNERLGTRAVSFCVVVKDYKVENWLISDPAALRAMKGKFKISEAFEAKVSPNRADRIEDAEALLKTACVPKKEYNKGYDPERISQHIDPFRAAANSRSFRKFLRELGVAAYAAQSKAPA